MLRSWKIHIYIQSPQGRKPICWWNSDCSSRATTQLKCISHLKGLNKSLMWWFCSVKVGVHFPRGGWRRAFQSPDFSTRAITWFKVFPWASAGRGDPGGQQWRSSEAKTQIWSLTLRILYLQLTFRILCSRLLLIYDKKYKYLLIL